MTLKDRSRAFLAAMKLIESSNVAVWQRTCICPICEKIYIYKGDDFGTPQSSDTCSHKFEDILEAAKLDGNWNSNGNLILRELDD